MILNSDWPQPGWSAPKVTLEPFESKPVRLPSAGLPESLGISFTRNGRRPTGLVHFDNRIPKDWQWEIEIRIIEADGNLTAESVTVPAAPPLLY